jgi:hypothetical protein
MKLRLTYAMSAILMVACVDEYDEANPPRRLDGPAAFASLGNVVNAPNLDDDTYNWVSLSNPATININVADAPGKINGVNIVQENEFGLPSEIATTAFDLNQIAGQEKGNFSINYIPTTTGIEIVEVELLDAQTPQKSAVLTFDPIRVVDACISNVSLVGFYDAVASGFNSETGENYADVRSTIEIYIRANGIDHPGFYRMRNGSFGLYALQGFADPIVNIAVCGDQITTGVAPDGIQYTGTVNDDGSISISWSNNFGDTGNVTLTPQD